MTFAETLMLAVVIAMAFPLWSWRNPTALGLALSYGAVRVAWYGFGIAFSSWLSLLLDLTVIAFIYAKPPAHDCFPYHDAKEQLRAFWCELSIWDRIVLAIFPLAWAGYFAPLSDYQQWHLLYWLAMAQFVAAGAESVQRYFAARTAKRAFVPEPPSSGLLILPGRECRGHA